MRKKNWEEWYPKDKKPEKEPWTTWQVPIARKNHYLVMMFILLVGVPWFLGIRFSAFSLVTNLLICDYILYTWYNR